MALTKTFRLKYNFLGFLRVRIKFFNCFWHWPHVFIFALKICKFCTNLDALNLLRFNPLIWLNKGYVENTFPPRNATEKPSENRVKESIWKVTSASMNPKMFHPSSHATCTATPLRQILDNNITTRRLNTFIWFLCVVFGEDVNW